MIFGKTTAPLKGGPSKNLDPVTNVINPLKNRTMKRVKGKEEDEKNKRRGEREMKRRGREIEDDVKRKK